jgi:hypothetical protein
MVGLPGIRLEFADTWADTFGTLPVLSFLHSLFYFTLLQCLIVTISETLTPFRAATAINFEYASFLFYAMMLLLVAIVK